MTDLLPTTSTTSHSYSDIRSYTSQSMETRLEVLASDDDPRISRALNREAYQRILGLLDRHYNLIVVDTGTGILDSAIQGLMAEADEIVLVIRPGLDGVRVAAATLDWLDEHDYSDLVSAGHRRDEWRTPGASAHRSSPWSSTSPAAALGSSQSRGTRRSRAAAQTFMSVVAATTPETVWWRSPPPSLTTSLSNGARR